MYDSHSHFTGALPWSFIWNSLLEGRPLRAPVGTAWNRIFGDIEAGELRRASPEALRAMKTASSVRIAQLFGGEPRQNLSTFFETYELFQDITRDAWTEDELYEAGARAIADQFFIDGVDGFEIFAGPKSTRAATLSRFRQMIRGFAAAERAHCRPMAGRLRITLPRVARQVGTTLNAELIEQVIDAVSEASDIVHRISGFDFSGPESPNHVVDVHDYVRELDHFRSFARRLWNVDLAISVHCGEDLLSVNAGHHLESFAALLEMPVNIVGHGTFLWAPAEVLSVSAADDRERHKLLQHYCRRGVVFELCPTANLRLTPIRGPSDIPLRQLRAMGARCTINTDNPTIFSTTLRTERGLFTG